jgi:hypothetical protein
VAGYGVAVIEMPHLVGFEYKRHAGIQVQGNLPVVPNVFDCAEIAVRAALNT